MKFEVPQQATLRASSGRTATSHSSRSRLHLRRSQTVGGLFTTLANSRWLLLYFTVDVRLTCLNKNYLLTYLLTFQLRPRVCLYVSAVKGKRLELPTSKSVEIIVHGSPRHAFTPRIKGQIRY